MIGKTVLVIDDDQPLVGSIREYLEAIGFKVAVAFDGLQGILQAHQARPDIIFLDFNMPGGGGATVYERLRNAADTCRIPIIFTTGVNIEDVKSGIKPSPQTFFLKKPVSLTQIGSVLAQVLRIEVPLKPAVPAGLSPAGAAAAPVSTARAEVSPAPGAGAAPPGIQPGPPPPLDLMPDSAAPASSPRREVKRHEFEVRVTYADTDKLGIIYYANYFKYFELGRTELLRSLGVRYRDLELERKLYLPVVEARCEYLGPSRYDDLLVVRTWLSAMGQASVRFQNEIWDRDSADRLVARGYSRHAVVSDRWRPSRIPADLRALLDPYTSPS